MRSKRLLPVVLFLALMTAGLVWFFATKPPPLSSTAAPAAPEEITYELTWAGLAGRESHGGTIGTGDDEVSGFDLGLYVVAGRSLVLRAISEKDNDSPRGTPEGSAAYLYLADGDEGVGAGSQIHTGHPGSNAISGGGPHGSEVIQLVFSGDAELAEPRFVDPSSIVIRVEEYKVNGSDLSVQLHTVNGDEHDFAPVIVEPLLYETGDRQYELRFRDLPGIEDIEVLKQVDVRSGDYDPADEKLTGGHFWLSGVSIVALPRRPVPSEQFD